MSLKDKIVELLKGRSTSQDGFSMAANMPLVDRENQLLLLSQHSVAPRKIIFTGNGRTLALTLGYQRLFAIEVVTDGSTSFAWNFADDTGGKSAVGEIRKTISAFLTVQQALEVTLEPVEGAYSPDTGILISGTKPKVEKAPAIADEPEPTTPAPKPQSEKPEDAEPEQNENDTSVEPSDSATPSDLPVRFLDHARKQAVATAVFGAPPESESTNADMRVSREDIAASEVLRKELAPLIGDELLLVISPQNADENLFAIAANDAHGCIVSFKRQKWGQILSAWQTAEKP